MIVRIWRYILMLWSPKARTEIGDVRRTWWARKGAEQYPIVYVVHNSRISADFSRLFREYGEPGMIDKGLWYGYATLYFVKRDDWEAIAKLADAERYRIAMWDVVYKDHNPFFKEPKEQSVE